MKIVKNQKGFSIVELLIVIVIVGLLGAVGWLVYDRQKNNTANNVPAITQTSDKKTETNPEASKLSYQSQKVTSGKGRFTVELPQGWGEFLRPLDSDWLLMPEGTKQPIYTAGKELTITDLPGFGADGPRVFSMIVFDNIAPASGESIDFTISNNEQPILGKKYTQTFTKTTEEFIDARKKGDKDYKYVFKLKDGNTLQVSYSVYVDDANDQNKLVDEIVKTIVIKN